MPWEMYKVVFKVLSSIHIGYRKYGNVMETRHYVPARVLLGALTARITRLTFGNTKDWKHYRLVGEILNRVFTTSYFFPTTNRDGAIDKFPWDEDFPAYEYIGSYVSTALNAQTSAAEAGSLHEVEFIAPRTLHSGKQVYLSGYCFLKNQIPNVFQVMQSIQEELQETRKKRFSNFPPQELNHLQQFLNQLMQNSNHQDIQKLNRALQQLQCELRTGNAQPGLLHHLQIGGERTYGWGLITLSKTTWIQSDNHCLFENNHAGSFYPVDLSGERPALTIYRQKPAPLHVLYEAGTRLTGTPEPMTRTLWWARPPTLFEGIAYPPGTQANETTTIQIGMQGYGTRGNRNL